jgi:dTMP kinase
VLELNRAVTGGLMPERTFVLALDADTARTRQGDNAYLDRIERESEDFRRVVADGYRELGILFPKRVRVIDAEAPVDAIAEQVREQVRAL